MKLLFSWLMLGVLCVAAQTESKPAAKERVETVFLFENRKVAVAVPEGLGFSSDKDDEGTMAVRLADPKDRVRVEIVFAPDPEKRFARAADRQEKMVDMFQAFVADSKEKAMQFEELAPASGGGTFCVFTDAKLAGGKKIPAGDFLHFTTGLKSWPGVVVVFRVFCNDTTSKEYRSVMAMLRQSVHEAR